MEKQEQTADIPVMGARGGLYFPIKLRCSDTAALLDNPWLGGAIARALGRSFSTARNMLPRNCAFGDGVCLSPASLDRSVPLDAGQQKALLDEIDKAIGDAARAQSLPLYPGIPGSSDSSGPADVPSERFNPARFDRLTRQYELPSYGGGKAKARVKATSNPFAKLLDLYLEAIDSAEELRDTGRDFDKPSDTRIAADAKASGLFEKLRLQWADVDTMRRFYLGEVDPSQLSQADAVELLPYLQTFFNKDDSPNLQAIARREKDIEVGIALSELIRAHVAGLNAAARSVTDPNQKDVRDVLGDIGAYYLEAAVLSPDHAAARIAFLDTFYGEGARIILYAGLRFARTFYAEKLKPNLPGAIVASTDLVGIDQISRLVISHAGFIEGFLWPQTAGDAFGDLPRSQQEIGNLPTDSQVTGLIARVLHMQVELPALVLLMEIDALRYAINQTGESVGDWNRELVSLSQELTADLKNPDIEPFFKRADAIYKRVDELRGTIYSAVRSAELRRKIGEQIPLMIIGGEVTAAVGAWVELVTAGSRWLTILAEGAALTLFNGLTTPSAQRPSGVSGWAIQLGENLLLTGLGKFVGALGEGLGKGKNIARGWVMARRAAVTIGGTVVNSFLMTAVQSLDAHVRGGAGESSFSELLTSNLIMSVIGAIFGSSVRSKRPEVSEQVFAALPEPEQAKELQTSWGINGDAAQRWLRLRKRTADYQRNYERVAKASRTGKLSPEDFEAWRNETLDLARDLAENLDLVEMIGGPESRQQTASMLDQLTEATRNMKYSGDVHPVPELTPGLTRVGEGPTYTYDPAHPPTEALKALREAYENDADPNVNVADLPGGGWEATDAGGKILFQALPLGPEIAGLLPSSLDGLAGGPAPSGDPAVPIDIAVHGPKAEAGLARVRLQTDAPELLAQLAEIANRDPKSVYSLLQILARGDAAKHGEVWHGISKYLKKGNAKTLVRAARLAGDTEGRSAFSLFRKMASWQDIHIAGLEAIYQVRPETTGPEINVFLGDFGDNGVKETLQDIAALAPRVEPKGLKSVIGRLFTPFTEGTKYNPDRSFASSSQTGAVAELYAGVEIAKKFPTMEIAFQVPEVTPGGDVRINDIVVRDPQTGAQLASFEIKEITSAFLGPRAPGELAKDIALDVQRRAEWQKAGVQRGPFETFRWRIRGREIQAQAIESLRQEGNTSPTPQQIDERMRGLVRPGLADAFLQLPEPVRAEYQNLFLQNLPFVQFF